jgi:hypothetical protein
MNASHSQHLLSVLNNLFLSSSLTDITLKCEGRLFNAHRVVLVAFSSVFEALLGSCATVPTDACVELQTVTAAQLEAMLLFMYTGALTCAEGEEAAGMLCAAEALGVTLLQNQLSALVVKETEDDQGTPQSVCLVSLLASRWSFLLPGFYPLLFGSICFNSSSRTPECIFLHVCLIEMLCVICVSATELGGHCFASLPGKQGWDQEGSKHE